jgi:hypothetical protein
MWVSWVQQSDLQVKNEWKEGILMIDPFKEPKTPGFTFLLRA